MALRTWPALAALLACWAPAALRGEAGVLLLGEESQPDPRRLALAEMRVDVRIDNGFARVQLEQIFANRTAGALEGRWLFALPDTAAVSDFAVWDDVTRVPGVILERRRAADIYEALRSASIDPGLLQQGEYDADEARRAALFSAKITPIPAWGFKRVEMEYRERVAVENLTARFALPLRPGAFEQQTAGRFELRLEIVSERDIADFQAVSAAYPLRIVEQDPNRIVAELSGENVVFSEDLAIEYRYAPEAADSLTVLTYRDPNPPPDLFAAPVVEPETPPGYFVAQALLAAPAGGETPGPLGGGPPRTVVALFDASLSMQWEKLERSFNALAALLLGLREEHRFNILVFSSDVRAYAQAPQPAGRESVEAALAFVREQLLRGGTGLEQALAAGVEQFRGGDQEPYLALFTDGGATQGLVSNSRLAERFDQALAALPEERRPRVFVFGVGDDANLPLLRMLAAHEGLLTRVRSTEPIDFKLGAWLSKIGRRPVQNLSLEATPPALFDLVYPLEATTFAGSLASWAGRYLHPATEALFRTTGDRGGGSFELEARTELPERNLEHPDVPRAWARARVDALLAQIEREGESDEAIEEIIRLSKRFKFVTPYTSFLAAPRALLRPRVIRPGDPLLRVRTDESITSVTALFPFGLIKKLRYLPDEDIWQTRFLAPKDMPDGSHEVRLVLRDREGRVYREKKSFLIASQPPVIRVRMERLEFRRGQRVELKASASRTTRTLTARMYGSPPVDLRWNPGAKLNTGWLAIPADLPAGEYKLRFTAEDFAHNVSVEEVRLAVLP